jgi:hypothetical protein
MTAIRNPPPFACDKENIVFAYREYLRIMEHWRKVLPPDRFIEVSYEDLVQNRDAEVSRVLEFLEISWHDACSTPELNSRSVQTPSLWQVRQPINMRSVGKWDAYREWLGPFESFL